MDKFTLTLALAASTLIAAQPLSPSTLTEQVRQSAKQSAQDIRGRAEKLRESANVPSEVEAKRQEIEDRIAERQQNIREKLSGKRAEVCKEREARINQSIAKRIDTAERHFEKFKSVQEKLLSFIADNQLSVQNEQALQIIMVESEIDARAAIDAGRANTFSCEATDANAPGRIIREQAAAQKEALKTYLSSIKDYAAAAKAAAAQQNAETGGRDE